MATEQQTPQAGDGGVATVGPDTLTITDNRTGQTYERRGQRRDRDARWTCARSRSPTTTSA